MVRTLLTQLADQLAAENIVSELSGPAREHRLRAAVVQSLGEQVEQMSRAWDAVELDALAERRLQQHMDMWLEEAYLGCVENVLDPRD